MERGIFTQIGKIVDPTKRMFWKWDNRLDVRETI